MSLSIWRVIKTRYAHEGLSGEGARLYGGRWTSPGHPVIYCSQHLSLAVLEILVHVGENEILSSYSKIAIDIPEENLLRISVSDLPLEWDIPFPGSDLQKLGDSWLRSAESLTLAVPSVTIKEEHNYLINPLHPDFESLDTVTVEPLPLDVRLFKS